MVDCCGDGRGLGLRSIVLEVGLVRNSLIDSREGWVCSVDGFVDALVGGA